MSASGTRHRPHRRCRRCGRWEPVPRRPPAWTCGKCDAVRDEEVRVMFIGRLLREIRALRRRLARANARRK